MNFPERNLDFIGGEVLLFDKELHWTSFDLVQKVRNLICKSTGLKKLKVGHAGTLDPLATGLMVICTGKATKCIESYQEESKEYFAELKIGATTPSLDKETEENGIFEYNYVTPAYLIEKIKNFTGIIEQEPPVFSAIKVNGKRAFHYARQGFDLNLQPRKVVIESIDVKLFDPPKLELCIKCGKGTYIRSLARDIGEALGCGAYLTGLRRTKIGNLRVEDACNVDEFVRFMLNKETK